MGASLKAELENAGFVRPEGKLYVAAVKVLQHSGVNVFAAQKEFTEAIKADADLLRELTLDYLRRVAQTMRPGGNVGAGQLTCDTHAKGAREISASNGSGGHSARDAHISGASDNLTKGETAIARVTPSAPVPSHPSSIPRKPAGAGALTVRSYDTRVRGESWLLSYGLPNGPTVMSLKVGELEPWARRLARESASSAHAAIVVGKIASIIEKRGVVSPDIGIDKILTPGEIATITKDFEPSRIAGKAKPYIKAFVQKQIALEAH